MKSNGNEKDEEDVVQWLLKNKEKEDVMKKADDVALLQNLKVEGISVIKKSK